MSFKDVECADTETTDQVITIDTLFSQSVRWFIGTALYMLKEDILLCLLPKSLLIEMPSAKGFPLLFIYFCDSTLYFIMRLILPFESLSSISQPENNSLNIFNVYLTPKASVSWDSLVLVRLNREHKAFPFSYLNNPHVLASPGLPLTAPWHWILATWGSRCSQSLLIFFSSSWQHGFIENICPNSFVAATSICPSHCSPWKSISYKNHVCFSFIYMS